MFCERCMLSFEKAPIENCYHGSISFSHSRVCIFTSTKSLAEDVVTYALVADRIIDGRSNEPIEQQAIIVHQNLVKDIISVNQLPTNIDVVRLMGGTLIPGMTNAHEHPLLYKHDEQNAHLLASSAYKALLRLVNLQRLLKAGWTSMRVMGDGDVYFVNQDLHRVILVPISVAIGLKPMSGPES